VRSVQVHDTRRRFAEAGQRVALNLAGVERHEVARGDVILTGETDLTPTYLVDATVRILPGAAPLQRGARIHVHHGTRESPARVAPLEGESVGPGERALVQLRLDRAIVPARGDRLVLRQVAPPDTIGGAVVLDPRPRKHGPGESHARRLHAIESGDPLEALRLELESARSGLESERGEELLEQLEADGEAVRVGATGARWFAPAQLEHGRRELLRALSRPEPGRGLNRGALAAAAGLDAAGAGALLEQLAAEGEIREREGAYVSARAPSARDAPLGRELLDLLGQDGLAPRAAGALATATGATVDEVTHTLDRLAGEGAVVRLQRRLYYEAGALEQAQRAVVELCERDGSVTIARLRDALSTSRKHAQAILEHLDARRITRRVGDEHVLRARF
jgi:selenocysteine-specific elongation factor